MSQFLDLPMRYTRAAYYRFGFGRSFAGQRALHARIAEWERSRGKLDSPQHPSRWNEQYENDTWAYMGRLNEVSRYSAIIGYLAALKPDGSVLDVGCGDGLLFERYRAYGYERWVGIDIAAAAIAARADDVDARTSFEVADAESYQPRDAFDVIVFNESLYYFHHPLETLARYAAALAPDGILVVSLFLGSRRAMAMAKAVQSQGRLVDITTTRQGHNTWVCLVLSAMTGAR